jgi:two-component system, NtrC family, response regulator AtoC
MSHLVTDRPPAAVTFELVVYTRQNSRVVPLLPNTVLSIGRSTDAAIVVDDASVSRHHARLHVSEEVEVEDLGSSNGTTLVRNNPMRNDESTNGSIGPMNPNERNRLRPGDVLRVGSVVLALQVRGRPASGTHAATNPILVDPEMLRVHDLVKRAAATELSVLILGETGAGKEVMAETIHRHSRRVSGPFLKLNCAALADSLLESELFGHERGSFTGAHTSKAGLLEATDGGTVFLDEIGEMPLGTQAKLLRVLEERSVIRVGSTKPRQIDVRFVTATNRDLNKQVNRGAFRRDLYYRINGLTVRIPPLRQRPSELEPLALHFLRQMSVRSGQGDVRIARSAIDRLKQHNWPGNVRELRNVMERAALLCNGDSVRAEHIIVEPGDLPEDEPDLAFDDITAVFVPGASQPSRTIPQLTPTLPGGAPMPQTALPQQPADDTPDERTRIVRALEACGGNQTRAAEVLGVSRRTLINRLEEFSLPRPKKR